MKCRLIATSTSKILSPHFELVMNDEEAANISLLDGGGRASVKRTYLQKHSPISKRYESQWSDTTHPRDTYWVRWNVDSERKEIRVEMFTTHEHHWSAPSPDEQGTRSGHLTETDVVLSFVFDFSQVVPSFAYNDALHARKGVNFAFDKKIVLVEIIEEGGKKRGSIRAEWAEAVGMWLPGDGGHRYLSPGSAGVPALNAKQTKMAELQGIIVK